MQAPYPDISDVVSSQPLMHLIDPTFPRARHSVLAWHHDPTRHGRHIRDRRTLHALLHICPHNGGFILHARLLELVCPFPTCTCVAVFQVLPKMIGAEEFLGLVAFAEFVDVG